MCHGKYHPTLVAKSPVCSAILLASPGSIINVYRVHIIGKLSLDQVVRLFLEWRVFVFSNIERLGPRSPTYFRTGSVALQFMKNPIKLTIEALY